MPDGRFFPCSAFGHVEIVELLVGAYGAQEPPGWIKLAGGRWLPAPGMLDRLSQAQIDFVWDWIQARGVAPPAWFEVALGRGRAPRGLS